MPSGAPQREPDARISREDYLAWAEQQPAGRFERIDGVVVAMAPERVGHNICKFAAHRALRDAARQASLPCQVLGDRVVVSVDDSDFEPDVVLHCAARLPRNAIAVPEPLVIVEVLSPSTSGIDRSLKLREYFQLPSLRHYLLVWPDEFAHCAPFPFGRRRNRNRGVHRRRDPPRPTRHHHPGRSLLRGVGSAKPTGR